MHKCTGTTYCKEHPFHPPQIPPFWPVGDDAASSTCLPGALGQDQGDFGKKGTEKVGNRASQRHQKHTTGWHPGSTGRWVFQLAHYQLSSLVCLVQWAAYKELFLALAVAGNQGQQFLYFPGESRCKCRLTPTNSPHETVKYAFFSPFFPKQLSWLSLLPVSFPLCSAHLLRKASIFNSL